VNLVQIRSAVPQIFRTQTKTPQIDGAKNRTFRISPHAVKTCHYILHYNASVSWWILKTLFVPVETEKNTQQCGYLTASWRHAAMFTCYYCYAQSNSTNVYFTELYSMHSNNNNKRKK